MSPSPPYLYSNSSSPALPASRRFLWFGSSPHRVLSLSDPFLSCGFRRELCFLAGDVEERIFCWCSISSLFILIFLLPSQIARVPVTSRSLLIPPLSSRFPGAQRTSSLSILLTDTVRLNPRVTFPSQKAIKLVFSTSDSSLDSLHLTLPQTLHKTDGDISRTCPHAGGRNHPLRGLSHWPSSQSPETPIREGAPVDKIGFRVRVG